MTPEQKAAYIQAQTACALIEMEGMKAENQHRITRGETIAYDGEAFMAIIEKYGIHNNGVIGFFHE